MKKCDCDLAIRDRLLRIEGQIRGVENMVAEGRNCEDVLTQLSAVSSAITNVAKLVLEHHIDHCMSAVGEEYDETVEDLKRAIASFAKMK